MPLSVFESHRVKAYPHQFAGTMVVEVLAGGIPTDTKVAENWLKTKIADADDIIRDMVAQVMLDRGVDAEAAAEIVAMNKHLNGFKRDELGLYIEGRQLKAGIKEAASIRWAGKRWGPTNKGTISFFAEHVFVLEERLHVGVQEPTGINQRFVHTWRGNGIQYEEFVQDAKIDFTIATDYSFTDDEWALLWLTAEANGIGASRSQGYGRYSVVKWEKMTTRQRNRQAST